MRLTVFWARMRRRFGETYADSLARDLVVGRLGGRTAVEAIEAGVEPGEVWAALCEVMDVPATERH